MENDRPLISIIMPVYNGAIYLEESIESIIAQTFTQWELIIIDDASTDNSRQIATKYATQDSRIYIYTNNSEKGLAGALNTGLAHARGEYIARADADDINVPGRLHIEYDYLQTHPKIAIVGGWYKTFGNNKQPRVRRHPSSRMVLAWKYLTNTYFCHPTVLFRKKILEYIPKYPIVASEDFAFFSEVIHIYQGHNIPKVLIHYREHTTNYSVTKALSIRQSVFETYKKNYSYYEGTRELRDVFYSFHADYRLSRKNVLLLIRESFRIGKKMLQHYSLQKNICVRFSLYITILMHFCIASVYSATRAFLKK